MRSGDAGEANPEKSLSGGFTASRGASPALALSIILDATRL